LLLDRFWGAFFNSYSFLIAPTICVYFMHILKSLFKKIIRVIKQNLRTTAKLSIVFLVIFFLFRVFNTWFYSHYLIKNSILNILIFVASVILAFLSLLNDLGTWSKKKILSSFTFKMCLILFACDLAFIASDKKDEQNDTEKINYEHRDSVAKANLILREGQKDEKRNKLYQDSLNSGLKKMAIIFNTALGADQNKYKEARDQIDQIVKSDSAKSNKFYSIEGPILDINSILFVKETKDSLTFQLKLECRQSTSYNVHLITKVAYIFPTGIILRLPYKDDGYDSGEQLESGKIRTAEIKLPNMDAIFAAFNVEGYYTNFIDQNQRIPFNKILIYNIHKKGIVGLPNATITAIRNS